MEKFRIDLDKINEAPVDILAEHVKKLFTNETSFDNIFEKKSHLYHQNEVFCVLFNLKNSDLLLKALGLSWLHAGFMYPELYVSDIELFADAINGDIQNADSLVDRHLQRFNL